MSSDKTVAIERLAVRPRTLAQIEDCSIAEIYKRLDRGEYTTYRDGSARLITMESVRARHERLAKTASTKPLKIPGRPGRPKKTANES